MRRALGRQPDNPFLGRHTLDFGPRGVDDAAAGASGTMPWEAVGQVEETASHLYLFISPLQGVIIPKRGQSADVLQAGRAQLRAHVPGAVLADAADKQ
ncbi:membrane protein [Bordetella pertussis]|nr:membrane protein [Bordetella pertussis]CFN63407.1 membrane protein [Bordetella pertussis]CFP12441.1 membrane protein [Bordetella pertussis]CPL56408.1 membrane protein [Bordetella pertussis]